MSDGKVALCGQELTRKELFQRIGDVSQIADIRPFEFTNGSERGVRAAEFYTSTGLEFTVLLGRGMDIDDAKFKGMPISWQSQTGPAHPAVFDWRGLGPVCRFAGSLVMGCGPGNVGIPGQDQGEELELARAAVQHPCERHLREEGMGWRRVCQCGRGHGVYFRWTQATMPYLVIGKMPSEKHYVIGLGIDNATAEGRAANRETEILRSLEADELAEIGVEIGVLSSPEEIEAWKDKHA